MQTYSIINPKTQNTLTTQKSLKKIQHYWNHIPRRKTSQLFLINNTTGEILKIKPKK